ncbi:MAG: hypothetical protein JXR95_12565 [Deltaproteobacteria bacterium]|nr:hypothetical protein [Deltaproteobacteria bacterium]
MNPNKLNSPNTYGKFALDQIPRFLSTMDRNPLSKTFGCANREYWLARAVDFPSSIAQYGILGLTLAYTTKDLNSPYYGHQKIGNWIKAGLLYLPKIQHNDGSFDEFYPNERGWAGPTGFLLHSMTHAYRAVENLLTGDENDLIRKSMYKAAKFLGENDEIGVLANHHAMAILPLREAIELLDARDLEPLFEERKNDFLGYCNPEGWCLEYDGIDPGYLSATVSFIARTCQSRFDKDLYDVAINALNMTKYFVYPNHHYGGTLGSRETLHFYPHGYEVFGREHPIALSQADYMLQGFLKGASVYPALQAERYFVYRIPEFLFSARDFAQRPEKLPPLPWQSNGDSTFNFPEGGIWGGKRGNYYIVANLAKGGNFKLFKISGDEGEIITSDTGISGQLKNGTFFTSSWIDEERNFSSQGVEATVKCRCFTMNSQTFDPVKMTVFRAGMAALGWHHKSANQIKGAIRKVLMLRNKTAPVSLTRVLKLTSEGLKVIDRITCKKGTEIQSIILGEELPVRYVPQSRYFQPMELDVSGRYLSRAELDTLRDRGELTVERMLS